MPLPLPVLAVAGRCRLKRERTTFRAPWLDRGSAWISAGFR